MNEYKIDKIKDILFLFDLTPPSPSSDSYQNYEAVKFLNSFLGDLVQGSPLSVLKRILSNRMVILNRLEEPEIDPSKCTPSRDIQLSELLSLQLPIIDKRQVTFGNFESIRIENEQFFTLMRIIEYLVLEKKYSLEETLESSHVIAAFLTNRLNRKEILRLNPNFAKLRQADFSLNSLSVKEAAYIFSSPEKAWKNSNAILFRIIVSIYCFDPELLKSPGPNSKDLYLLLSTQIKFTTYQAFRASYSTIRKKLNIKLASGTAKK
jgi:hypothetical protein